MTDRIGSTEFEVAFDLNSDGGVDELDRTFWVEDIVGTNFGDANLDGSVDFADFLSLVAWFDQDNGWAGGDFDGSGLTDFTDFSILAENFGERRLADAEVVPEPSGAIWIFGLLSLWCTRLLSQVQSDHNANYLTLASLSKPTEGQVRD